MSVKKEAAGRGRKETTRRAFLKRAAGTSGALLALGAPLSESSGRALGGIANTILVPPRRALWIAAGHTAGLAGVAWLFLLLARNPAGDALALALARRLTAEQDNE